MRIRNCLAALAVAAAPMLAAGPARALPVVNTYQVVSRFAAAGSVGTVTQLFTLAFDPTVSSGPSPVQAYSTSNASASFNPAGGVQFAVTTPANIYAGTTVTIGGAVNGVGLPVAGTPDFETIFFVSPTGAIAGGGQLIPFNADASYSTAGATVFDTFDVTVTLVASSVPEAASWATMLVGIGAAGGMLRARRRRVLRPA